MEAYKREKEGGKADKEEIKWVVNLEKITLLLYTIMYLSLLLD